LYRLLIIDDEEDIRDSIKDIFQYDGNETFAASDGLEGLTMTSVLKPDLILCDIMMPGLDGFQVRKKLNENNITRDIPFIYLTAKAELTSFRRGMNLGADDYIIKPIRNRELIDAVYNRIRRIEGFKTREIKENDIPRLTPEDKILLNYGKEHLLVPVNDITFINVKENYTLLNLIDGKKVIQKKSLKKWQEMLPEKTFVRVHHNTLINFNYIEKIEPFFNGSLIARIKHHPESIICSKRYSQKIKKLFQK
jgi:DNA-binding LytR/AlgR family response regulator